MCAVAIVAGVDFGTLSARVTLLDSVRGRLGTASADYPLARKRDDPDYATQSQVLIVTDVKRGDLPALANAYARLIVAAEGGTLGLFTAIRRLRSVHARIADRLSTWTASPRRTRPLLSLLAR